MAEANKIKREKSVLQTRFNRRSLAANAEIGIICRPDSGTRLRNTFIVLKWIQFSTSGKLIFF